MIFDDIYTDADGCISKEEASVRQYLIDNFADIDKDKGGTICVDEYTAYHNIGRKPPEEVEVAEAGAVPVK